MQNKMKENASFKYYIYMVAKSRAINHIKIEKRRTEITEKYLYDCIENTEKDVLEFITKEETKKEVIEAIELLDEKYKNAIYLVKIEGLSYLAFMLNFKLLTKYNKGEYICCTK